MVRGPNYDESGIKRGAWSSEEDEKLRACVERYGHWNWRKLPSLAGLLRCGKSCRLRWVNYLQPDVKRGDYSEDEETLIINLHQQHGNKWSIIAAQLAGRSDNEIKNHWHTTLKKRTRSAHIIQKREILQDVSAESSQLELISNNESSSASNIAVYYMPNILESSSSVERSTSTSSSSGLNRLASNLRQENNYLSWPFCEEYDYTNGSDFWTEPFMEDKYMASENEYQSSLDSEGRVISPYSSFYNEGMDYFINSNADNN